MWVEDSNDLTAVFLENTVASSPASLFSQPDAIATFTVVEAPLELSGPSQVAIEHAINSFFVSENE